MCQAAILTCVLRVEYEEAIRQRDDARAERDEARAALSAAEVARDAFATEVEALRAERDTLGIDFKEAVGLAEDYKREAAHADAEMERLMTRDLEWQAVFPGCCHPADLAGAVAELRAEVDEHQHFLTRLRVAGNWSADLPPDQCIARVGSLRNEMADLREAIVGLRSFLPSSYDVPQSLEMLAEIGRGCELREAVGVTAFGGPEQEPETPAPANPNRAKLQAVYDALAEHCQTAKHPSPLLLEQLQSLYRLLEDPA